MTLLDKFVPLEYVGLDSELVENLVLAGKLPVDIAFRSQRLPYEMIASDGNSTYQSWVVEKDVLAATGYTSPSEFYDQYLAEDAVTPPCVTVREKYDLRRLIASSDDDWHMYADYRTILINSDVPHPLPHAKRSWHTLILTALRHTDSSLDWVENYDFDDVYKRNRTGNALSHNIASTVLRDEVLLEIAAESAGTDRLAHDSIIVGGKPFSALELLLADNHPDSYGETYATWQEQSSDAIHKKISSRTAVETLQYFYGRIGQTARLTDFQLSILEQKYHEEDDDETYKLIVRTERSTTL